MLESAFVGTFLKPPAFQFYADDFLGGTVAMTHTEKGLYITLLCVQWTQGWVFPDDFERIAGSGFNGSIDRVKSKFLEGSDGYFRNERLEYERKKQAEFREKQAENGRKGGRPRAKGLGYSGLTQKKPKHKAKKSSPSPSPSPSPISDPVTDSKLQRGGEASRPRTAFKIPSISEIKLQASKIGCSDREAEKFLAHFESNGWRVGSNPMRSWSAALQKWHLNGSKYGVTPEPQTPQLLNIKVL